jgi:hypothetical protein
MAKKFTGRAAAPRAFPKASPRAFPKAGRRGVKASSGPQAGKCGASAPTWLVIAAFVLLAVLAAVLGYRYVAGSSKAEAFRSQRGRSQSNHGTWTEKFSDGGEKAQLVFLYMEGCGWCVKFKPQWDAFVTKYGSSMADGGVGTASYERSDPRASEFKADGYPTVLLVPAGGAPVRKFEGERTPAGLIAFVRENGYMIGRELFYSNDEGAPATEWGNVGNTVSDTKEKNAGPAKDEQKGQQRNVGGNPKSAAK